MESPAMLAPTTNIVGPLSNKPFIHRYYLLLKGHYFLFFSAFGVLYPVLNITLRSRGLSNIEISYINLIIPFIAFFTNPLMGFVADHSRRYLLTFNFLIAITTILYCLMFMLPSIKTDHIKSELSRIDQSEYVLDFCASQEVATKCSSRSECGCVYHAYCNIENFTFTMSSADTRQSIKSSINMSKPSFCGIAYRVPVTKYLQNSSLNLNRNIKDAPVRTTCEITCSTAHFCHGIRHPRQTLYVLLYSLFFVLGTNFLSNSITIGASIGFAALTRGDMFGQQRVWGTIGFGLSAFAASRLYGYFKTEFVYIIMFSIITVICIIVTTFIHIQPQKKRRSTISEDMEINEREMDDIQIGKIEKKKAKDKSQSKIALLIPLLKKLDVIIFLSLTFIWGMSYAGLDPYVYLYIDEIAPCQSHSIVGWMSLICATSEVVALFLAERMLKLIGTNVSSVIILIAFAIRFSGYYFIRRPYFFLFMETMHYFNFGIFYVLTVQKADEIAPPGLSGTLQGIVYGFSFGLGRGVGLIFSSFIYTHLQSRVLFLCFAVFNAVAAVIYSVYFIIRRKYSKTEKRVNNNINVPKIVIDSEPNIIEDPLLTNKNDNRIIE